MERSYKLFLKDMISAIDRIEEYTSSMTFDELKENRLVIDAVIRNLEIIGEAAANIPEGVKKESNVPWNKIKNFRNVVIHKY